ncbi:MAG: flagellar basal body rod protein FlgB [Geminicoccaceae bacterium]|nr:flagellar basal body rod protein FlgB [Geminicoccaceae bacterium]
MSVLFSLLSAKGGWLQARHAVVTQNLANADTPGYAPRDLKAAGFEDLLARARSNDRGLSLKATDARHIEAVALTPLRTDGRAVHGYETSPAGNEVLLEEQSEKLMQTRLDYETTTNVYKKYLGLLRTAIGGASS